jgi:hypothetical protein
VTDDIPRDMTHEHLESDIVAGFAEQRLSSTDRVRAETHLAECAACRADLLEVTDMLASARRRRRALIAGPLLASAAAVFAIMISRPAPSPVDPTQVLRRAEGTNLERLNTLTALSPVSGGPVDRAGLRFTWQADGPDAIYEVTVTDSSGLARWRARTADTTTALPDSVRLRPGTSYHWWVDVLLSDGRIASTGVREFTLRP